MHFERPKNFFDTNLNFLQRKLFDINFFKSDFSFQKSADAALLLEGYTPFFEQRYQTPFPQYH